MKNRPFGALGPLGLGACALVAIAFGCTAPPPPPLPPPLPPAPPATSAIAASGDAGPPEPAPPPQKQLEPRRSVAGSTRGAVACGKRWCNAEREKCVTVEGPDWACLPRDDDKTPFNGLFMCDDGTDCPYGQTCCLSFASAATAFVCGTRKEGQDCKLEVCEPGGARCPAGQKCEDDVCWPEKVPGPLCGKQRCAGDTRFCAWQKGKGECVNRETASQLSEKMFEGDGLAVLRCTQNSDCGTGMKCCTGMGLGWHESYCSLNCDLVNSMKYCATDADCPTLMGTRLRCLPEPGLPPWSRLCKAAER